MSNFKDIPSFSDAMASLKVVNQAVANQRQVSDQAANKPIAPLCPHCKAEWSHIEFYQKECFTCGYPNPWDAIGNDDIHD